MATYSMTINERSRTNHGRVVEHTGERYRLRHRCRCNDLGASGEIQEIINLE